MRYLIVDGYNVISNWPELVRFKEQSLEQAREVLVHILVNYGAWQGDKIIIVFDGHQVKGGVEHREKAGPGVEVVFTREGETADNYIERIISSFVPQDIVQVATSDWVEQQIVWRKGAMRLSSRELMALVGASEKEMQAWIRENNGGQIELNGRIEKDLAQRLEKWRRS